MKIPYFPGCTLYKKAKGFDVSARASAKALGFELSELPQWNCCGATFPLANDNLLALVAPTRILVDAQREGKRLATLCSICYNVLKRTNKLLQEDEEKREKIDLFIEEEYKGELQILHFLEILRDEVGFEKLRERVEKRLEGLKAAPYYGCLLLRPQEEMGLDDPDDPTILHDLLKNLGCEVVDFPFKTECCGSYLAVSSAEVAMELSYAILNSALREGAEVVVTSCPLCQFNLDYRQEGMSKEHSGFSPIPILYFTQLLGIALGLDSGDYGFEKHYVDPRPLLAGRDLIPKTSM